MPASQIAMSSAGSTFSVCLSQPANELAATYAALTWIPVGEVVNIGEFSRVYNPIEVNNLSQRRTRTLKGSYKEGSPTYEVNYAPGDPGQVAMLTALNMDGDVSFRIAAQDGTTFYSQGVVMSAPITIGGVDDVTGQSFDTVLNKGIVTVYPA